MTKIVHIINPVKVNESADLYNAQPITFESIIIAKKNAKNSSKITICTTQFEEDKSIIPDEFTILSNLEKSILDIHPQLQGKKLPLIKDILDKTKEVTESDYIIYSNSDIALMPFFYDTVLEYINSNHDAIVINRRRISNIYKDKNQLPLMYAELGKSHPGYDCFIIKKELLQQFILGNICVGIPFIEVALIHNIASFAQNPIYLTDKHLTFHIGLEVMPKRDSAYYWANRNEFFKNIYPKLKPYFGITKFPYAYLPFYKRAIKWVLNPSLFTSNYLHLEGKNLTAKLKFLLNEIRWRVLQR